MESALCIVRTLDAEFDSSLVDSVGIFEWKGEDSGFTEMTGAVSNRIELDIFLVQRRLDFSPAPLSRGLLHTFHTTLAHHLTPDGFYRAKRHDFRSFAIFGLVSMPRIVPAKSTFH